MMESGDDGGQTVEGKKKKFLLGGRGDKMAGLAREGGGGRKRSGIHF